MKRMRRVLLMLFLCSTLPSLVAAEAPKSICNKWYCHIEVTVSEEPEFCARLTMPKDRDGQLDFVWASRIDVLLASRLSGESCENAN